MQPLATNESFKQEQNIALPASAEKYRPEQAAHPEGYLPNLQRVMDHFCGQYLHYFILML
jgi:hypothetical protein